MDILRFWWREMEREKAAEEKPASLKTAGQKSGISRHAAFRPVVVSVLLVSGVLLLLVSLPFFGSKSGPRAEGDSAAAASAAVPAEPAAPDAGTVPEGSAAGEEQSRNPMSPAGEPDPPRSPEPERAAAEPPRLEPAEPAPALDPGPQAAEQPLAPLPVETEAAPPRSARPESPVPPPASARAASSETGKPGGAAPPGALSPPSPGQYTVILASFRERERADKFLSALDRSELNPLVWSVDLGEKGTWYRVSSGAFPTYRQANRLASKPAGTSGTAAFVDKMP